MAGPRRPKPVGRGSRNKVINTGTRNARLARQRVRSTSARRMTPDSSGSFRGTDIVPQWNLFRQIGGAIRRATGGK